MAKRSSKLVGLEIEPSAVHAAAVSANGRLTVDHAASAALPPGIVRDGEVADVEALAEVLRELFADHKELDKRVRVGVANAKIVVRIVELPPITDRRELEAAVRFQAQDEIPMPLDSAVLDFEPLGVVETPNGPRQRVVLVAARRDMVERVLLAVRAAGLRPEGVDLSAFAMVRALTRRSDSAAEATLFLSIGGLTNLAVAQGTTVVFTRVVGSGLEQISAELAERRSVALDQAQAAIAAVGLADPVDPEDDLALDARALLLDGVRRIASDVRASVDFHLAQSGIPMTIGRCVLTGAAAVIDGFGEALQAEMGLPVGAGLVDGATPSEAVAAGLALEEAVA